MDWSKLPLMRQGQNVDLLAHAFAEQIHVRLIDKGSLLRQVNIKDDKGQDRRMDVRLLTDVINWPIEQLQTKSRHCRLCGSAFDSVLPAGEMAIRSGGAVSADFTDTEHISFTGDICPMCRIYAMNSHQFTKMEHEQGSIGMRKSYRGAFAVLMPSSHFTYRDTPNILKDHPPLDIGGRFSSTLQRATFTSQEFVLFNALSRRVIGKIWQQLNDGDGTLPLPLPYLGAILLTHEKQQEIRRLFDHLDVLFSDANLWVYPFKTVIQPAVELAIEIRINSQKHHTRHTYLKTNPITVTVSPESKFMLLVDNGLQLEVTRQFFADRERLNELLSGIKGQKRRRNWLLSVLQGNDPATATAEAFYDDRLPLQQAENVFWAAQVGHGSPAEQWRKYEEVQEEIKQIVSRYPLLIEFFAN